MARLNLSEIGQAFLKEWESDSDYILAHTSGSTGKPKEIRLLKEDMRQSARATNRFFGIGPDSLLVSPLSAGYIAGKMMIVRALEAGCRLIEETPSNHPLKSEYGTVALLPIVPSQIPGLLESEYVRNVQNVIVGGAPMSPVQEQLLMSALTMNAYATYGMTETCSHVALRKIGCQYYQALPGVRFEVDNRSCLKIIALDFSFKELQTNDVVKLEDVTHFQWKGRVDNVIISGGIKIFPEEIERELSGRIPLSFYFIGEPDDKWGQKLIMKVEYSSADLKTIESKIRNILESNLPRYHQPKEIIFLKEFPRTSSGKILRK